MFFLFTLLWLVFQFVYQRFWRKYMPIATGKLTALQNISSITSKPLTKFYKLKEHYIDKNKIGIHYRSEVMGKNNQDLYFYIDVVCPISDKEVKGNFPLSVLGKGEISNALVVVDGVPLENSRDIGRINPADVEDVMVVKSTAGMALYGPGAKNGVIIITTKKDNKQTTITKAEPPKAWLGIEFKKRVSNNLNEREKESAFKQFTIESEKAFKALKVDSFIYLDRIGNNSRHKGFVKAVAKLSKDASLPIILEAINEPFEARNGNRLGWIFKAYGIGAAVFLLMVCIPKLNERNYKLFLNPPPKKGPNALHQFLALFAINNGLFVSNVIIALNVLMFIIMIVAGLGFLSFPADELLDWGANYRPAVLDGQWWRLLTAVFLHGGLMHLLNNMFSLILAAIFLEGKIGKRAYAAAYIICGIAASLASIWWHPATVGVGASGAIFGLYGVSIVLILCNRSDFKNTKVILFANLIFLSINLLLGMFGNADNAAHVGGLTAGLIIGLVFYFILPPPKPKRKYVRKKKLKQEAGGAVDPAV